MWKGRIASHYGKTGNAKNETFALILEAMSWVAGLCYVNIENQRAISPCQEAGS